MEVSTTIVELAGWLAGWLSGVSAEGTLYGGTINVLVLRLFVIGLFYLVVKCFNTFEKQCIGMYVFSFKSLQVDFKALKAHVHKSF